MPLQTGPESNPSELPPPPEPQLEIVQDEESSNEKDSSAEDKAKERDSIRGILEKDEDFSHYNPMWPPKTGRA